MTSDNALSNASSVKSKVPRHYIVISRPVTHSELSPRAELVKGQYESVELIREVPLNGAESDENPVEWIMVTRSDPGGGIPRFLVDRGTPGGIVSDVSKFLDWAITTGGDLPDRDTKKEEEEVKQANEKPDQGPTPQQQQQHQQQSNTNGGQVGQAAEGGGGILSAITGAVATGAVAVGSTVSTYIPYFQHEAESLSESSVDSSDDDHYSTADESNGPISRTAATKPVPRVVSSPDHNRTPSATLNRPANNNDRLVVNRDRSATNQSTASLVSSSSLSRASTFVPESASGVPSAATVTQQLTNPSNSSERDLLKHSHKRIALDEKYAQQQAEFDVRAKEIASIQNASERAKATERHDKDVRKATAKYEKEARKTEEKRGKNARRVEEKRKKVVEKDAVVKANREVVDWKSRCEGAERENEVLRRQVQELESRIAASGVIAGSAVGQQQPGVIEGRARY